jgi:hypothetical protein
MGWKIRTVPSHAKHQTPDNRPRLTVASQSAVEIQRRARIREELHDLRAKTIQGRPR